MILGNNITLNRRETATGNFVCLSCFANFEESGICDNTFDDAFGTVYDFAPCCPHCGSDDFSTGKVWLDSSKAHRAIRDHYNKDGKLEIRKGQRYVSRLVKGYTVDRNGDKQALFFYEKVLM